MSNKETNNARENYHPEIGKMFDDLYNDTDLLREVGDKYPEAKTDCLNLAETMCKHLSTLFRRLKEL